MKVKFMNFKSGIRILVLVSAFLLQSSCMDNSMVRNEEIKIKVGAAAEEIMSDDSMDIAGGIQPWKAKGQEAPIRATAVVIEGGEIKLCIVSCDVINVNRDYLDDLMKKIETELGIPFSNILISATHTHHAPATGKSHVAERNEIFVNNLKDAIFKAVAKANEKLKTAPYSSMYFWLGQEATVGQNSRLLLSDSTIFWVGSREDAIRPTGTFDPDLPVIAFKSGNEKLEALIFNHSTHNIGAREGGVRSPAFYGLAAQDLEQELDGTCLFMLGACGSVHALGLSGEERAFRIREAVKDAYYKAQIRPVFRLVSVKEEFKYQIRTFNEAEEEKAVTYYCTKRGSGNPGPTIAAFRARRAELAPHQGETMKTWLQVMQIGDVAIVAVSGEFFNELGLEIKRRSPFRYTYIVELANDNIGYIPDKKGFKLGGYQVWTGAHSRVAEGTGEAIVVEAIQILSKLYNNQ
ncbi:MAG TPA: hypothetical protein DDY34_19105 [Bacteroidales bacterium]|nr:hypothetical protein [Bacteroidales bacterium]